MEDKTGRIEVTYDEKDKTVTINGYRHEETDLHPCRVEITFYDFDDVNDLIKSLSVARDELWNNQKETGNNAETEREVRNLAE